MIGKIGQLNEWADDLWISLIENSLIDFFQLFFDRLNRTMRWIIRNTCCLKFPFDEHWMLWRRMTQSDVSRETFTIHNLAHLVSFLVGWVIFFFNFAFFFTQNSRFAVVLLGRVESLCTGVDVWAPFPLTRQFLITLPGPLLCFFRKFTWILNFISFLRFGSGSNGLETTLRSNPLKSEVLISDFSEIKTQAITENFQLNQCRLELIKTEKWIVIYFIL